ncbi:MAG: hypothetical protein HFI92_08075 [Lachnospiraceae bacterium]|nr:hypothetical protein [Lachnospiraceae bacterium]
MTVQRKRRDLTILLFTIFILLVSIFGPEQISRYNDRGSLNQITVEETGPESAGYRYTMNSNEKLYLLSECLNHQVLPESELSAMTRISSSEMDYQELMGTYAFVVNRQGPSGKEITDEEIYEICNREIKTLKSCGVLPEAVREVNASSYLAVLYSAIDVLEPQNNMSVWKVSLSTSQQNADKTNRLIDAYIDAGTGKIYGFYVRTENTWSELDPEQMMEDWESYLGLTGREDYESVNPLLETTPNYRKYRFPGMDDQSTVVTVGFYDGINELFIKLN